MAKRGSSPARDASPTASWANVDTVHDPSEDDLRASAPVKAPTLTILYHPELSRVGDRAELPCLALGHPASLSRVEPLFRSGSVDAPKPLADPALSRSPLTLSLHGGSLRIEMGNHRTRVLLAGAPLDRGADIPKEALERGVTIELAGRIVLLLHLAEPVTVKGSLFTTATSGDAVSAVLIGNSGPIQKLRQSIRRVADLDVPVLIRGESGSGKELVANAIHALSGRRNGPFVAVNLGAVPPSLAAAELFGADRGAFTGSVKRREGYFSKANGGTLFLDEVGEAPPEIQVALLRAVETGQIQPVGADEPQPINARLLAATDADLEAKVQEGAFRAPLLHRLAAYEVRVPPLRHRRDDLGKLLTWFFYEELSKVGEAHKLAGAADAKEAWLPASLVAKLAMYDWPGNVRQLRNVVRQIVIGNRGRRRVEVEPELERLLRPQGPSLVPGIESQPSSIEAPPTGDAPDEPGPRRKPSEVTEAELEAALRASRWDVTAAAARLHISRPSLYMLFERFPRLREGSDTSNEAILRAHEACGGDVEKMVDALRISEKVLRRKLRDLGVESKRG